MKGGRQENHQKPLRAEGLPGASSKSSATGIPFHRHHLHGSRSRPPRVPLHSHPSARSQAQSSSPLENKTSACSKAPPPTSAQDRFWLQAQGLGPILQTSEPPPFVMTEGEQRLWSTRGEWRSRCWGGGWPSAARGGERRDLTQHPDAQGTRPPRHTSHGCALQQARLLLVVVGASTREMEPSEA